MDPQGFVRRCNEYFAEGGAPDSARVETAKHFLTRDAASWAKRCSFLDLSWEDWSQRLVAEFNKKSVRRQLEAKLFQESPKKGEATGEFLLTKM